MLAVRAMTGRIEDRLVCEIAKGQDVDKAAGYGPEHEGYKIGDMIWSLNQIDRIHQACSRRSVTMDDTASRIAV